jgi:hypothetical protein
MANFIIMLHHENFVTVPLARLLKREQAAPTHEASTRSTSL